MACGPLNCALPPAPSFQPAVPVPTGELTKPPVISRSLLLPVSATQTLLLLSTVTPDGFLKLALKLPPSLLPLVPLPANVVTVPSAPTSRILLLP